jgi:hypothetical protein
MQVAMKVVEEWCRDVGLSVNPDKTATILFTRKRNIDSHRDIHLFGKNLALVNHVKYLGIILDSKLNWNLHVEERIRKACMAFGQCGRAIGKT